MFLQIATISFLQKISQPIPVELSIFFARYLAWVFCVILVFFVMRELVVHAFKRQRAHLRKVIYALPFSVVVAFFIQWFAKFLIHFGRPFTVGIQSFYEYGGYDSFPSGHALVFMSLAVTVFKFHKIWGSLFILLAIIIGIFRVVVGVHWPLDIIVGWITGVIIGALSVRFIKKIAS